MAMHYIVILVEASTGIEPVYTDLQDQNSFENFFKTTHCTQKIMMRTNMCTMIVPAFLSG